MQVRATLAISALAVAMVAGCGLAPGLSPAPALALRSRFASRPDTQPVLVEVLERLPDSTARDEPGMPLGLMPGMRYDEVVATLNPGELMVLSSDGIVEAHGPGGEHLDAPGAAAGASGLAA